MPIYEFHCKDCRKEFKTLRSHKQLESVLCPTCGNGRVARLLSVTAAHSQAEGFGGQACAMPMGGG